MMGLTHAVTGVAIAIPFVYLHPELALPIAIAAYLGGAFPDVDIFVGAHRRSLHYPVYFTVLAVLMSFSYVTTNLVSVLLVTVFVWAAAVHSVMDIAGAGVEGLPWEETATEAVYIHPQRRWATAKDWVPYDGSPHDLFLMVVLSVVVVISYDNPVVTKLMAGSLLIALVYTVLRRRLPGVKDGIENRLGFYPRFFP